MSKRNRDRSVAGQEAASTARPTGTLSSPHETMALQDAGRTQTIRKRLNEIRRQKQVMIGGVILIVFVAAAAFAPLVTTNSPTLINGYVRLRSPNTYYFFGTDSQGRDVFARVIYGARLSLRVGFLTSLFTLFFGTLFGLIAGYYRKVDGLIMRITDGMMAFPGIILAIGIMAVRGASVANIIIALTVVATPRVVRLVRSIVITLREEQFVDAAIATGNPSWRVLLRHILPNTLSPLIVQISFIFAEAILAEATLSFLGAGAPPEIPSWGAMLADSKNLLRQAPWTMFFPGAALALTVFALNLVGDGLRDMLDPRLRQR
jgi:peptide/nickel transport system permease protein